MVIEIALAGNQEFMGKMIPVLIGGFGKEIKCICDKTIAEIHGMEVKNVRARITDNIKRFKEGVDYIDLKRVTAVCSNNLDDGEKCLTSTTNLLFNIGYSKQSVVQARHIYMLSREGYAKLIKIMNSDLSWSIHDRLIKELW